MATETFLATALPHSASADEPFHVSVFFTHRLTPDGGSGELRDFPVTAEWTTRVAKAKFELIGSRGAIEATPVLDPLDTKRWAQVFPPGTPVRGFVTPTDLADKPWVTYPAHRAPDHAKSGHLLALLASPTSLPPVETDPLVQAMGELTGTSIRFGVEELVDQASQGELDAPLTSLLDHHDPSLAGRGSFASGEEPAVFPILFDVHQARRYYQRPEQQRAYQPTPTGEPMPPLERPDPDFHEQAGALGDTPSVLRMLGLVVDLRVADHELERLAGSQFVQVRVTMPGIDALPPPRTACTNEESVFTAAPRGPEWRVGMLRVGEAALFDVLDLDPDASALKLESHLRSAPRLIAAAANGDPVNAAPATLRGNGFALTRLDGAASVRDHVAGTGSLEEQLTTGQEPLLNAEDVTRGLRVEVWDDVSNRWHTLHSRRLDLAIKKAKPFRSDVRDTGFLQGAALSAALGATDSDPLYIHEVFAGWEGWSLSAPRPGRVVDDAGDTSPEPTLDPVTPLVVTTKAGPARLPRLRYGRSYAFRVWATDLAGNSTPHGMGVVSDSQVPPEALAAATSVASLPLAEHPSTAALRRSIKPPAVHGAGASATGYVPADLDVSAGSPLDHAVRARLAARAASRPAGPTRRAQVDRAFAAIAGSERPLVFRAERTVGPQAHARALTAHALSRPEGTGPGAGTSDGTVGAAEAADLVTTPRPFLRWDPVLAPAVVPRHPYSPGEQPLRLVIRSGVDVDAATGALTVVPPGAYAARHPGAGLRGRSERHLAPPKTSQLEAELHGLFDAAIGSDDPAAQKAAYGLALREAGTFLDTTVADIANPGQRLPQPGVQLHATPTADPDTLVTDLAALPRGAGLPAGQYVVHDVDAVVLPYLPDPLAAGVALVFPDAGQGHHLPELLATESVALPFGGTWPEQVPWRLVLSTGDELRGRTHDNVIEIEVPPGEQLRLRVSSTVTPDALQLLGLLRSLGPDGEDPAIVEAALDGWLWWLTPYEEMRLVHAVQRPVEAPRLAIFAHVRSAGDTVIPFVALVDVHAPSTERLDVEAAWTEQVDDLAASAPGTISTTAAAFGTAVAEDEEFVLFDADNEVPPLDGQPARHAGVHKIGDTRHRTITYAVRATTRYREFFPPALAPGVEDLSVVSEPTVLSIPSTARPTRPSVRDVLPLFVWQESTEPDQPFAVRRHRRAGVRIWLERPWFSSGDDELLGVVLSPSGTNEGLVSEWAGDPVWHSTRVENARVLPLSDLIGTLDQRPEPGRPVIGPVFLPDPDRPPLSVAVLGYRPEFHPGRGMWFVDVRLDPGATFWPFVRLAVARFQPDSIVGQHLSPVVATDFVQVAPERIATLSRPDQSTARVVLTGPAGWRIPTGGPFGGADDAASISASRTVQARLERLDPAIGTDLGWVTEATAPLELRGLDGLVASWTGTLDLPTPLAVAKPGRRDSWRVAIEEFERLPADPPPGAQTGTATRLAYADHLPL